MRKINFGTEMYHESSVDSLADVIRLVGWVESELHVCSQHICGQCEDADFQNSQKEADLARLDEEIFEFIVKFNIKSRTQATSLSNFWMNRQGRMKHDGFNFNERLASNLIKFYEENN